MFPILFNIGNFPVHSYGVFIALGFLICVRISKVEAIRQGMDGENIVDMAFWCLLVGMLGARTLFIITRWSYFKEFPNEIWRVWEGGLVFYGGPIAALFFIIWWCKKYKLNIWKVLDLCAVAIPVAHAFGRIGCLSSGCCYGKMTNVPWAIHLHSELVSPEMRGLPLHPTQIYEMTALFVLFFYLLWKRRHKRFDGELALIYVIVYAIIRSIVEIYRGDSIRGFVVDNLISTSQFISILTVIAALIFWRIRIFSLKQSQLKADKK